jgi:hypothetical protein
MPIAPRKPRLDWLLIGLGALIALGFCLIFISNMYQAIQGIDA